jgi:hypothetical protein
MGLSELSVTVTVKVLCPDVVGTPVMSPVDASTLSPAGSDPEVTDQVYGAMPPLAETVAV